MIQHAGHFHNALQLDLTPTAAGAGAAQGGHQLAGLGAELLLSIEQPAHLFVQRGIGAGPGPLHLLNLGVDFVERGAHRRHHIGDGLPAQVEIAACGLLRLGERRFG